MKSSGPSAATEDYLKVILELGLRTSRDMASMGDVADALGITPGTVTTMVKKLSGEGLITYIPRSGCSLTETGRLIAMRTLRRHRILETFLVQTLEMDWAEVHDEAERMEHCTSDEVINRLWRLNGKPATDPHGSPIPDENLIVTELLPDVTIDQLADGTDAVVTRLSDRDAGLLEALQDSGIAPGVEISLKRNDGTGTVRIEGELGSITLAVDRASKVYARPIQNS